MCALTARDQHIAISLRIIIAQGRARLHLRCDSALAAETLRDDVSGICESLIKPAAIIHICIKREIALHIIPDLRRVCCKRRNAICHTRQNVISDPQSLNGIPCQLTRLGDNNSDNLSGIAHFVDRERNMQLFMHEMAEAFHESAALPLHRVS